jgi:hypothetical protein
MSFLASIAREFGIEPWALDMDQVDGLLDVLVEMRDQRSGTVNHRRIAERMAGM